MRDAAGGQEGARDTTRHAGSSTNEQGALSILIIYLAIALGRYWVTHGHDGRMVLPIYRCIPVGSDGVSPSMGYGLVNCWGLQHDERIVQRARLFLFILVFWRWVFTNRHALCVYNGGVQTVQYPSILCVGRGTESPLS